MKLENQVCSLKLAKKLKKLGVKQESLYYWTDWDTYGGTAGACKLKESAIRPKEELPRFKEYPPIASAFTVAELGEMLPESVHFGKGNYGWIRTVKCADWIRCEARNYNDNDKQIVGFKARTEANARAEMLIYLIENKLIK